MPIAEKKLKFTYYKEVNGTEKNTWTAGGTSSEVFVEDISVETKLAKTVIAVGVTPKIIPLGPESRTCKIVGTFTVEPITAAT